MRISLAARLLHIAAIALVVAGVDWALKAWALEVLRPDQVVFNTDRPWQAVLVCAVLGAGLVAVAQTRLLALGAGVVVGGGLGNLAELAAFGRVTDFVPLGVPFRGAVWSPADFFLALGLVLLWIGAVRARGIPSEACTTSASSPAWTSTPAGWSRGRASSTSATPATPSSSPPSTTPPAPTS